MNRLQKKCVIATASFHLLLLVILIVGPAFFNAKPKVDDSRVLDVIPANLVDAAINGGVKNPTPPAPVPIVTPPQPQPIQPAPKPIVQPAPAPQPAPVPVEIKPHTPQVDLHVVTHPAPKDSTPPKPKDDPQAKLRADLLKAAHDLQNKLSPPTAVVVPGDGGVAAANYAQAVKSIYYQAWNEQAAMLPDDAVNDDANTIVSVTIGSDGTVINARIITPPSDARVAAAVQRMLEHVKFIAPFPPGMTDPEWSRNLKFNLKTKQMPE
jgi:TonB family protein